MSSVTLTIATTTTTTSSSSASTSTIPLVLHLPPTRPRVHYQPAYQALVTILHEHRHDCDFLSNRIFRWSASVLKLFESLDLSAPENAESIEPLIQERVYELIQRVLVNPLDGSRLQKPLLVRDWVWEHWMYKECLTLFSVSPLDEGKMIPKPRPHVFANKILILANNFINQTPNHGPASSMVVPCTFSSSMQLLAKDPQFDGVRRMVYIKMCKAAIFQRENQRLRQNLEDTVSQINVYVEEMRAQSLQLIQEAQEEARVAEETIRKTLEDLEQTHQEALSGLQSQMEAAERTHRERIGALETQIAAQDQIQTEQLNLLRQQHADTRQAYTDVVADLTKQMETLNFAHTTTAAYLSHQLEQSQQQHQAAVETVQQTKKEVTHLGEELHAAQARLQVASQSLSAEKTQNAAHAAQIHNLNQQFSAANRQIHRLEKKVHKNKCVIS